MYAHRGSYSCGLLVPCLVKQTCRDGDDEVSQLHRCTALEKELHNRLLLSSPASLAWDDPHMTYSWNKFCAYFTLRVVVEGLFSVTTGGIVGKPGRLAYGTRRARRHRCRENSSHKLIRHNGRGKFPQRCTKGRTNL